MKSIQELTSIILPYSEAKDLSYTPDDLHLAFILLAAVGAVCAVFIMHEFLSSWLQISIAAIWGAAISCALFLLIINIANAQGGGYAGYITIRNIETLGTSAHVTADYEGKTYQTIMSKPDAEHLSSCKKVRLVVLSKTNDTQSKLGNYKVPAQHNKCLIAGEGEKS